MAVLCMENQKYSVKFCHDIFYYDNSQQKKDKIFNDVLIRDAVTKHIFYSSIISIQAWSVTTVN